MEEHQLKPLPGQKWIIVAMAVMFCVIVTFLAITRPASTGFGGDGQVSYVAETGSRPFHKPHCDFAQNIPAALREKFQTRDAAVRSGYRACHICRP